MPAHDKLLWIGAAVALVDVLALFMVWRGPHGTRARVLWTVLIVLLPLAGAVAWLLLGHERRR